MAQLQLPVGVFGRWLLARGISLPFPLTLMSVANLDLPLPELATLVPSGRGAAARPVAPIADLPESSARDLEQFLPYLQDPQQIAFVTHIPRDESPTISAAALIIDQAGLVLIDNGDQVRLEVVAKASIARDLIDALPGVTRAPFPTITLGPKDLEQLYAASSPTGEALERAADAASVDRSYVRKLLEVQRSATAVGTIMVLQPGAEGLGVVPSVDWVEAGTNAWTQTRSANGAMTYDPVDRARLLAALTKEISRTAGADAPEPDPRVDDILGNSRPDALRP